MKAEEQRFNSEFLPLFDSDLNLGDIPNLLKVRDSFEESTLTKYLMDLDKPKRKDIFNKVFKLLINEYLDHKGIKPKKNHRISW